MLKYLRTLIKALYTKNPSFISSQEGHKNSMLHLAPNVGPSELIQDNRTFLIEYKKAEILGKAILAALFVYPKFVDYQMKFVRIVTHNKAVIRGSLELKISNSLEAIASHYCI